MHFRLKQIPCLSVRDLRASIRRALLALQGFVAVLATIAICPLTFPQYILAQAGTANGAAAPHVVLSKLTPPVFPPLARQARIAGEVRLSVSIHPDGSIESITAVSGNAMLVQAALDSAKQSQFECRGCGSSSVSQSMTYSFQISQVESPDPCCCTLNAASKEPKPPASEISQSEDHITIAATTPPICICPDACEVAWAQAHSRFRSVKCLYLWKCGTRFIGIE
jgi:TonB family protein